MIREFNKRSILPSLAETLHYAARRDDFRESPEAPQDARVTFLRGHYEHFRI